MKKYITVDEFISDLRDEKKAQVDLLRKIIMGAVPELSEHIKWNAPSYLYKDVDRITFNTMNKEGVVKVLFHMGATRKENKNATPLLKGGDGLIVWSSDIRGVMSFVSLEDIETNKANIASLVKRWLDLS